MPTHAHHHLTSSLFQAQTLSRVNELIESNPELVYKRTGFASGVRNGHWCPDLQEIDAANEKAVLGSEDSSMIKVASNHLHVSVTCSLLIEIRCSAISLCFHQPTAVFSDRGKVLDCQFEGC